MMPKGTNIDGCIAVLLDPVIFILKLADAAYVHHSTEYLMMGMLIAPRIANHRM